jgi:phospholipase/lecithinase/hemolysin
MRHTHIALALAAALSLAACGGGSSGSASRAGDQTLKVKYSSMVSFGDSLSDVGSYKVGTVAAIGGGKYTINGSSSSNPDLSGKVWIELMAAQFGLPAPCPAMTGLEGDATKGFAVPIVKKPGCLAYAQGGSRVTNPLGAHHKSNDPTLGQLTVPVVTQVANHLAASGGKFSGTEVVFVMAGGNDILALLDELTAGATAAGTAAGAAEGAKVFGATLVGLLASGATNPQTAAVAIGTALATEAARPGSTSQTQIGAAVMAAAMQPGNSAVASATVYGPMVAKAQSDATAAGAAAGAKAGNDYAVTAGPKLVQAMGQAGAELAAVTKTQIVGKGANYVVLNNLPDFGITPSAKSQSASTQALIAAMVDAFNKQLVAGIAGESKILYVDLFTISHDQATNPGPYGLTNTTTPACGTNALGGASLGCNLTNVIAGDVSHYMFADGIHPTPFEHSLVAKYVAQQMIVKGWM